MTRPTSHDPKGQKMQHGIRNGFGLTADVMVIVGVGTYLAEKTYDTLHQFGVRKVHTLLDEAHAKFRTSFDALVTTVEFEMLETLMQTAEKAARIELGDPHLERDQIANLDVVQTQITHVIAFNLLEDEYNSIEQLCDNLSKRYKLLGIKIPKPTDGFMGMKLHYENEYGVNFDDLTARARIACNLA